MKDSLKSWQVEIQGDQSDIEHLAKFFSTTPRFFRRDDRSNGFTYQSEAFLACDSPEAVQTIADQELLGFSGLLKVDRKSVVPVRAVGVFCQNDAGGRVLFASIHETVAARADVGVIGVNVTDEDGNDVTAQPAEQVEPRIVVLAKLAAADAAVAKVLRLIAAPGADSWVSLYRIHEVVEGDVGGEHDLKERAWVSPRDLKRFKQSANSVTVAGDDARHGTESTQSPPVPMSPGEAKAYVECVIQAWLASKAPIQEWP